MEILIGIFIIIITIFIFGFYNRKKIYQEVDRLEVWKVEIMNRPVTDEISKVKDLNMTGQTEELFEQWRNGWDEIVTIQLPKVEEMLFDAEEFADKYRFKKAKQGLNDIEMKLHEVDQSINTILEELNQLVSSEEKNRIEVEELKQSYRGLKKKLLAHRYSFGRAESKLEADLDKINENFKTFEEETKQGNYLEARQTLLGIQEKLSELKEKMELIPQLLTECQSTIPAKLGELLEGIEQMKQQGYMVEHIHAEKEFERVNKQIEHYMKSIESTEINEVKDGLEEIKESIETLYDLLEKEVEANHFVQTETERIESNLQSLIEDSEEAEEETKYVQQSYHLSEKDIEVHRTIVKEIKQIVKHYVTVQSELSKDHVAYTVVREELEEIHESIQALKERHLQYSETIQALRKDELNAREKIKSMQQTLTEIKRMISKSNLPGLPESFSEILKETTEKINEVILKLEEKPLNMTAVNNTLETSQSLVDKSFTATEEMLDQVYLAEKVIQYGNRYRRSNKVIAKSLSEAELSFRNFQYDTALEQAATALEEVEPGALKKIEQLISNE